MEPDASLAARLHLDVPLVAALLVLAAIGLAVLYSASGQDVDTVLRQATRLSVAFVVMFLLAQISPRQYSRWSFSVYLACVALLILVLLIGTVGKGAQRWISLGFFTFQPSELAKVAVPMVLARFAADHGVPPRLKRVAIAMLLILVPTLLVARQPDLGTALLIASSGAFVLFIAGLPWWLTGVGVLVTAASAPVAWLFMHEYQRQRVWTFLSPESDPLGSGYHIIQSKIAIGSGGIYGKGWLNGTQSQLEFLPERSTDFIFAVFSEEFGLLGVIVLLSAYLFVVGRGLFLAAQAQELFSRLLAAGLVLTFFVYVFVNVGMVSGLLPVVGIPLPLMSYGGTSLVTLLASFGILMSMHSHRRLLSD